MPSWRLYCSPAWLLGYGIEAMPPRSGWWAISDLIPTAPQQRRAVIWALFPLILLRLPFLRLRCWLNHFSEDLGLLRARIMGSLRVGFKGFPERLRLGWCVLRAWCVLIGQRADRSCRGPELGREQGNKVGWKGSDSPSVSIQASNPPRSVTSIQAFDQVALNKSQVSL